MNRRERRTAAARGKSASSFAPADIAGLMAQANDAYRRRRPEQAEIICKQVLSHAPTHATCLNLLGVVYQTSARHRPAIKLFAKALAVDDLDAGFHYNIACSYQALGEHAPATAHFKQAITLGMGGKKYVEEFVMENAVVRQCIARIVDGGMAIGNTVPFSASDIAVIANDIFLRCALQLTTIHGVMLELFLTRLRTALLRLASDEIFDAAKYEDVVELACALAQQCFINEYVFAQTDEEIAQANRLRQLLLEKLARGEVVSPLLLAAVAAYVPLHSLPSAKSLLTLQWPECTDDLLRLQVHEPSLEAEDRPMIPALTAVDDGISLAVMQQYDENPYPRWTVNPFAVRAADRKRQARPTDGGATARGEDILIAGCGTGQHPFSNAQYSTEARILAIDISRTSLAYARRKTREEGLQNIEYAQADILKLGGIGRSFDRIEAVGVLHHLADPKAGWRVLLSLLAPRGTMRVGLYSETARREVVAARALIAARSERPTAENIRALRQTVIRDRRWETLPKIADFYSMSGCRDLLFNVMEHRFTIPGIAAFLNEQGLAFHGFELEPAVIERFQRQYPNAAALTNLEHWHDFETANPDTFWHMYVFTVSQNDRASR